MPKCLINGKEADFTPGENLITVAKRVGIEIPYFCYHPGLSVVAQCRMCAVEIEKNPKLQTACSTQAAEGMVVITDSDKVKSQQKSTMEFLLVNHPLDCPICDKAGECDLQNISFKYGSEHQRSIEERRTYADLEMGDVIKKNMNRCIHCTRCIRFGSEVAGIREMVAVNRGNQTEITTLEGKKLETEYAGNYSDICPTGSLTLKDFRFKKRSWFLKKMPTICEGCSRGCNIEIHQDEGIIYRCVARENLKINKYWICDEGRFNFKYLHDPLRVLKPSIGNENKAWNEVLQEANDLILKSKNPLFLVGTDLTLEEVQAIQEITTRFYSHAKIKYFGTPGVLTSAQDVDADKILKRKSKTSNLHGVEKLGISAFDQSTQSYDLIFVFRGGRASLPALSKSANIKALAWGVFTQSEVSSYHLLMPGTGFAEKFGTITNYMGIEQMLRAAIPAPHGTKQLAEVLLEMTKKNDGVA